MKHMQLSLWPCKQATLILLTYAILSLFILQCRHKVTHHSH